MTKPEKQEFIALLKSFARLKEEMLITEDTPIADLGLDSIQMMFLVNAIDKRYGAVLPIHQFMEAKKVGDIFVILQEALA